MKTIKFTHLYLENFCGVKKLDTDLFDKTFVVGKNGVGKSTIKNAIYWVLFNKLADGSSPNGIRPHNEKNVDIDNIVITAVLTMDIDGKKVELKKTQEQKWVKHKGNTEQTFEGNVNKFEVNMIPKTEKAFKSYIEENIPLNIFYDCTNPVSFFGLDTKKRRAKLLELESNVTNEEVISSDKRFVDLSDELKDGTIDELIARSKKVISTGNEKLKSIPVRIDEVEKQRVDIDVAELELSKKDLNSRLEEIHRKQDDIGSLTKERTEKQDELMKLQFKLGDIQRDANVENEKLRRDIRDNILTTENQIEKEKRKAKEQQEEISISKKRIVDCENRKKELAEKWTIEKERKFDESTLVCPYCKQEYPEDKKEEIKADFETRKKELMDSIAEKGNGINKAIKEYKEIIQNNEKNFDEISVKVNELKRNLDELNKKMDSIPKTIDVSETAEYKEVEQKIAELEDQISKSEDYDSVTSELRAEDREILGKINEIDKQIALSQRNTEIDERVEELKKEQERATQQIVDETKKLDLLTEFNNKKMTLLSEKVNSHFDIIKFQLFRPLINGNTEDCCIALVNGTSYDGLLNTGNKILANIDICRAFQKKNEVNLPILVDDTESLDSNRIPDAETQMILFRREDEKSLEVLEK